MNQSSIHSFHGLFAIISILLGPVVLAPAQAADPVETAPATPLRLNPQYGGEKSRVEVIGTTAADVEDHGYCDGEQDRRLPNLLVEIAGGASGYSDLNGEFSLANEGSDPVVLTARLRGRWVVITDLLGPEPVFTGVAIPGVPFEIRWSDANSPDGARSVYLQINRIHDAVKAIDPTWTAPDFPMPVTINANLTCGA